LASGTDDLNALGQPSFAADALHPITVAREGAATDTLEGFRVYLRDPQTKRRISTVRTLGAVTKASLNLATYQQGPWPTGCNLSDPNAKRPLSSGVRVSELVMEPPDDGFPLLVQTELGGSLVDATYPPLPPVVRAQGLVIDPDGIGAQTNMRFVSKTLSLKGGTSSSSELQYETAIATDADGKFTVTLPPGDYDVILEPPLDRPLSKTILDFQLKTPLAPGDSLTNQQGHGLQLTSLTAIHGVALLADLKHPLAEAEVEVRPAASLRAEPDTHHLDDPRYWPRARLGNSDENGNFSIDVDNVLGSPVQAARYDVFVKPAPGTRLPWIVLRDRTVRTDAEDVGTITVPAPVPLQFALQTQIPGQVLPIIHALVQVFTPIDRNVPHLGQYLTAVEIGEARSDDSGNVALLVAPNMP
jgi:hypothetical protein